MRDVRSDLIAQKPQEMLPDVLYLSVYPGSLALPAHHINFVCVLADIQSRLEQPEQTPFICLKPQGDVSGTLQEAVAA